MPTKSALVITEVTGDGKETTVSDYSAPSSLDKRRCEEEFASHPRTQQNIA